MALPASVPTGTVTGTWYTPKGDLAVGTIVFLLLESVEVPDDPDGVVIPVKTIVDVPAGVLNQTLPEGLYQVTVRLSELYRVTKVVEVIQGVALNLPDAVGMLLPDPDLYDPVRSVNGYFPDQYGNIVVPGSGGGGVTDHGALTGLSDDDHSQYQTQERGDARYAPIVHSHTVSNVTGLQTALDGKQPSGDYATATDLSNGLATKANVSHTHVVADVTDFQTALATVKHRAVIVRDKTQNALGYYELPNTGDAWQLYNTPGEYTIPAVEGEDILINYNILINSGTNSFVDLAVVTGVTPTIQRYIASGNSTPTFQGNPGDYPDGAALQGRSGSMGFIAQASDIDGGNIRIRWACKTLSVSARMYASNNYPLILEIRNLRTPV